MFSLIVGNIVSCFLVSLLITVVLVLIVFILPKLISYQFRHNIIHFVVLFVAFVALFISVFMFVGAGYAKGYVSDVESGISSATDLLDKLPSELTDYANANIIDTKQAQEQANLVLQPIRDYLNSYMWKRGIWTLVIYSLFILFFVYQANVENKKGADSSQYRRRDYDF